MLGSMFAGTPGETEIFQDVSLKTLSWYGINRFVKKVQVTVALGSVNEANKLVPEGIEGRVAYKGAAADIVFK